MGMSENDLLTYYKGCPDSNEDVIVADTSSKSYVHGMNLPKIGKRDACVDIFGKDENGVSLKWPKIGIPLCFGDDSSCCAMWSHCQVVRIVNT